MSPSVVPGTEEKAHERKRSKKIPGVLAFVQKKKKMPTSGKIGRRRRKRMLPYLEETGDAGCEAERRAVEDEKGDKRTACARPDRERYTGAFPLRTHRHGYIRGTYPDEDREMTKEKAETSRRNNTKRPLDTDKEAYICMLYVNLQLQTPAQCFWAARIERGEVLSRQRDTGREKKVDRKTLDSASEERLPESHFPLKVL